MIHRGWRVAVVALAFWPGLLVCARAQTSLDILEKDLEEAKQQHQDAASQSFTNFLNGLDAATQSPDAALQLYQQAGGNLPAATPITTNYEHETPDEKSARLAKDRANLANFGAMLQLHCSLMRLAALFVEKPDSPTLPNDWLTWLKNTAQIYPQLTGAHRIRDLSMQDSPIGTYLGFRGWGGKDQGSWTVHDVPAFYHDQVLEPLRKNPTPAVLAAWDTYIAMMNADQPDAGTWNDVDYPALEFERDSDDFAIAPSTDKLQALVELVKAHPNHPKADDWFARLQVMMQSYRAQKSGVAANTVAAPQPDPAAPATNTTAITH